MNFQDVVLENKLVIDGDTAQKGPRFGIPAVGSSGLTSWIGCNSTTSTPGRKGRTRSSCSAHPLCQLHELHLDLQSGWSWKQHMCSAGLDFGKINQKFLGQKNQYVYMRYYGPWPRFSGLAKVDLDAPRLPKVVIDGTSDLDLKEPCIVASRRFERAFGHGCQMPMLETVAFIELLAGVPYGFHGIFINADQIANQNHGTL
ncbi:hypothetical protein SELMODRAFT_410484 [Selaginella moellendorffii]|uniref:9-cis-epoxycarotenoid dioxygenase n=1 Tax=Selaginella moellendorffii TaxID=88036 RepID=D8REW5_SELML|nr:hypothetical protein SELMODRAFT_410484 [Selaginella moellendorffii]